MDRKIAVITGASRGIGRSIAITLAKQGYEIVINYNDSEKDAQKTLKDVKIFTDGMLIKADVAKISDVEKMSDIIKEKYENIDVLVNNAGKILRPGNWNKVTDADWDRTYQINAKGTFNCIRLMSHLFRTDKVGHIINIASTVGESGAAAVISYGAAKAAVINMTLAFAKEFAPNIVVNAVAPGNIDTEMTLAAGKDLVDWIISVTPMKRLGTPQEVADLVSFLASDNANFITGQVISIDGGYSLKI